VDNEFSIENYPFDQWKIATEGRPFKQFVKYCKEEEMYFIPIIYCTNEDPRTLARANPDKYVGFLARLEIWDFLAQLEKDKKKYDWELTRQMIHLAPGEIPILSESDSGPGEIIEKQKSKRKVHQSRSFILTEASKKLKPLSEQA